MRILVADDSKAVRLKLKNIFEGLGHKVVAEAEHGGEVLSLYEKVKPDLVSLDLVMPEKGGMEVLSELKKADPQAKVVLVTSAATLSNMMRAKDLGALHFITKPFHKEKIEEVMSKIVSDLGIAA